MVFAIIFSFNYIFCYIFSRKKRYFILRKDIRALCYYVSREDLTLLGSVPLHENTTITNKVKSEESGTFEILTDLFMKVLFPSLFLQPVLLTLLQLEVQKI